MPLQPSCALHQFRTVKQSFHKELSHPAAGRAPLAPKKRGVGGQWKGELLRLSSDDLPCSSIGAPNSTAIMSFVFSFRVQSLKSKMGKGKTISSWCDVMRSYLASQRWLPHLDPSSSNKNAFKSIMFYFLCFMFYFLN